MDDYWEQRVSNILCFDNQEGNNSEDDLPNVTDETLEIYINYLKTNLVFPFEATYDQEVGPLSTKVMLYAYDVGNEVLSLRSLMKFEDAYFSPLINNVNRKNSRKLTSNATPPPI